MCVKGLLPQQMVAQGIWLTAGFKAEDGASSLTGHVYHAIPCQRLR